MAALVFAATVALYAAGMIMMCEAFLSVAASMELLAGRRITRPVMMKGTNIPAYRFAVVLGSSGFAIIALIYIYAQLHVSDYPAGYLKTLGNAATFLGSVLLLYGTRGLKKMLHKG